MKPPAKVYMITVLVGIVGMIGTTLIAYVLSPILGRPDNITALLCVPWIVASIAGVNLGFKEGIKAASSEVRKKEPEPNKASEPTATNRPPSATPPAPLADL